MVTQLGASALAVPDSSVRMFLGELQFVRSWNRKYHSCQTKRAVVEGQGEAWRRPRAFGRSCS